MVNEKELVLAVKTVHKGALFGHISNCGGTIKLNDFVGIRFVGLNDKFLQLQVVVPSANEPVRSATWVKTKTKVKKKQAKKESQVTFKDAIESEDLL